MSCSCVEFENQYGENDCKCALYREKFPDCACERESVSEYSPGLVADDEVLVRTLFREEDVGPDGRVKPEYFRRDPKGRGFSVDRVHWIDPQTLKSEKCADSRYGGYLRFIATCAKDVKDLLEREKRLFCVYDSGTAKNNFHADICQNLYAEPGTSDRRARMLEIAWRLRSAFCDPQPFPPISLT